MPRPFLPRALLLMLAAALAPEPAPALIGVPVPEAAPAAPAATPAPAAPEAATAVRAIPARAVPERADADEQFARDSRQRALLAEQRRKELELRLERIAHSLTDLGKRFPRGELRSLPIERLESIERQWQFYDRELADWRRDQEALLELLSEDAAQLAQRRAAWTATRDAASGLGIPSVLVARADAMVAILREAERVQSMPVAEQVELRRLAGELQGIVDGADREIGRAVKNYDRRLFKVDAPRFWEVWRDRSGSPGAVAEAGRNILGDEVFFRDYVESRQHWIIAHIAFSVLSLPLLLWLSVRSRKLVTADPELRSAERVLTRPLSAWLVLTLLGSIFFEPGAPTSLYNAVLLLASIPVLRLLPQGVFERFGRWPYIATGLYVLLRLGAVAVGSPFWYRTHLMVVGALALIGLLWMLLQRARRAGTEATGQRGETLLQVVGWLSVLALGVALVANLLGNVSLASVLTRGTVGSAYLGLALYAGAAALSAIVKLLLARRTALRIGFVAHRTGPLLRSLSKLIYVAAGVIWLIATLNFFRVYRPTAERIGAILTHPLKAGEVSITLASILLFFAAVLAAFWIARTVRAVLREDVLPRTSVPVGVASSVSTLTYYAMLLVGLLTALAVAGFQVGQLAIVFGALGVGVGLGLQDVVKNFVSGLILMFERPIEPGDTVDVAGISGTVQSIGIRATTIKGFEGSEILVPNGSLLAEKLINWTLSDHSRRLDVNVGVAYGTDARKVLAVLEDTARNLPGVSESPAPMVLFLGFGASSMDFSVRAWTQDFDNWVKMRSELAVRISEAFKANGIEIPFPQHDLHLRSIAQQAGAALAASVPRG